MNYKKEDYKILGGVLVILAIIGLFVFSIVSLVDRAEEAAQEPEIETKPLTAIINDVLPQSFRTEFMYGCMGYDYEMYNYCECALDYLDKNYTNSEIVKTSLEYEGSEELPGMMIDASIECLDLYVY